MAEKKKKVEGNKGQFRKPPEATKFNNLPREEYLAMAKKGREKGHETMRRKRQAKEILKTFMEMSIKEGQVVDIETIKSIMELNGQNISTYEAILLKQVQKALKGDLSSATFIRDTIGDKPTEKVEAKIDNPFEGLTTEELRKLVDK